jgi:hypothetical protein
MRRNAVSARDLVCGIAGALLLLAGIGLVAVTARGLSSYRMAAGRHGGETMELDAAGARAGQHGRMVRLVGTPRVGESPRDPEFNLRADTSLLVRHVDMFQWREIRIGNDVHYEMDWVDRPLDAGGFKDPAGHANPRGFPISGQRFEAAQVQIGRFTFSPPLVHALPGSVPVAPQVESLPANLAASFSRDGGYLVTSANPAAPRLGDIRVSWSAVPLQPVTIVARLDDERLVAAADAVDGKGYGVVIGDVPLLEMFPDLPAPPEFVFTRWVLSVLLASLGALLLLAGVGRRRDLLLALALGCLAVGAVAGVTWVGSDARLAWRWFALATLGAAIVVWRLRRRPLRR